MQKAVSYIFSRRHIKNQCIVLLALVYMAVAYPAHAAPVTPPSDFKGLVGVITDILSTLIVLAFALTFLVFVWGLIKGWIIGGDSAEGVESGKKVMVTGIIVLSIMMSIWGILALLQSSFQ